MVQGDTHTRLATSFGEFLRTIANGLRNGHLRGGTEGAEGELLVG